MTTKEEWKELVYTDGKIDEEKVFNELADYAFLLEQVPEIYCHITGGLLSKTNYYASTVIAEADNEIEKNYVHKDDIRDLIN